MDHAFDKLLAALRQVAEGGACDHAALTKIASPDEARHSLTQPAEEAYWALWRWCDDADIREQEPVGVYEAHERSKLSDMYLRLSGTERAVK